MHQDMPAVDTTFRRLEQQVTPLIDVEAGLRDLLLPARYAELAGAMAHELDTEAGLADLLESSPSDGPTPTVAHRAHAARSVPTSRRDGSGRAGDHADRVTMVVREVRLVAQQFRQLSGMARRVLGGSGVADRQSTRLDLAGRSLARLADRVELRSISQKEIANTLNDVKQALKLLPTSRRSTMGINPEALRYHADILDVARQVDALAPRITRLFDSATDSVGTNR
ncbi:hypothetical protein [Micromonospora cathayae]|uniref:Uncharacterized protein n=1 Tax=Micromonospora cathayae TaxID=3028804 RepID=A0ABY7ZMX2_9ACTN|nr:hypothetical protein [Micromonospora sp. HUAS 3]WDZ83244.1 hypothetical protein PVK37_22665 [Micromonospora sp. HUAS 3]